MSIRPPLSFVLALLLLFGPVAEGAPALSKGSAGPASQPESQSLTPATLKTLLRRLARLRQLRAIRVPKIERISRDEMSKRLRATLLDKKRTEATYADEAALLAAMQLRKDDGSLLDAIVARVAERTHVRYDHRRRRLWVVDDATPSPVALAGELCRALIDGRHRLSRYLRPLRHKGDRLLARHGLLAGDCAGVLIELQLKPRGLTLTHLSQQENELVERMAPMPKDASYLDGLLVAPLRAGLRFAMRLRKRRSWQRFDRIYRRPPRTSEQLLHPRLFLRNKRGRSIRARALRTFGKLRPFWQDSWGELRLRVMLATKIDASTAERAAAGWDGDKLVAYRREGEKPVVIHLTHWDSEADAFEFDNAQQRALLSRGLSRLDDPRADTRLYARNNGKQVFVQRFRRAVLTVYGVKADERETLQTEIWKRFSVAGRRLRPPK